MAAERELGQSACCYLLMTGALLAIWRSASSTQTSSALSALAAAETREEHQRQLQRLVPGPVYSRRAAQLAVAAARGRIDMFCDEYSDCVDPHICLRWTPLFETRAPSWVGQWRMCDDRLQLFRSLDRDVRGAQSACLVISIGVGAESSFERGLAERGCKVHAFDPTTELEAVHRNLAREQRWHFHFAGLRGNSAASIKNLYGSVDATQMKSLDEIISTASTCALHDFSCRYRSPIAALKIDCEGCEWGLFRSLQEHPEPLRHVDSLMLELHFTAKYGFDDPIQLVEMLNLMAREGFVLARTHPNGGDIRDQATVLLALRKAGWDRWILTPEGSEVQVLPCCAELHFMRLRPLIHALKSNQTSMRPNKHHVDRPPPRARAWASAP